MDEPFARPIVVGDDEDSVSCLVHPRNEWRRPLLKLLEEDDDIELERFWSSGATKDAPPLLLALHVTTGGPCCTISVSLETPDGDGEARRALELLTEIHEAGLNENRAAVVQLKNAAELYLAAVKDKVGKALIFWGFYCGSNAPAMTVSLLSSSRLPLVFDLDETLLVAFSMSTMEMRLKYVRDSREKAWRELDRNDGRDRSELQQKQTWLAKEEELLLTDLHQLRMFAEGNGILDAAGKMQLAVFETAYPDKGAPFERPVIRDPSRQVVFTRIHPDKKETSMIMRIRPGWDMLKSYLLGLSESSTRSGSMKQRFELYVCTAAEREYALEAWRVLDPDGSLIPQERRKQRIVCVPSAYKKTLSKVLGIGPCTLPDMNGKSSLGPGSLSHRGALTPMPLAIIVDDRLEVWEEGVQGQILHVLPYLPYKDEAASKAGLQVEDSIEGLTEEMRRIQSMLQKVRANVYWDINYKWPEGLAASDVITDGLEARQDPQLLLPSVRTVATLLKEDNLQVPSLVPPAQRTITPEPNEPEEPATFSATVSLVPQDPRLAPPAASSQPTKQNNSRPESQASRPAWTNTGSDHRPTDPRQSTQPAPTQNASSLHNGHVEAAVQLQLHDPRQSLRPLGPQPAPGTAHEVASSSGAGLGPLQHAGRENNDNAFDSLPEYIPLDAGRDAQQAQGRRAGAAVIPHDPRQTSRPNVAAPDFATSLIPQDPRSTRIQPPPTAQAASVQLPQDPRVATSGLPQQPHDPRATQPPVALQGAMGPNLGMDPRFNTMVMPPNDPRQAGASAGTLAGPSVGPMAPGIPGGAAVNPTGFSTMPVSQQLPPTAPGVSLVPQDPRQLAQPNIFGNQPQQHLVSAPLAPAAVSSVVDPRRTTGTPAAMQSGMAGPSGSILGGQGFAPQATGHASLPPHLQYAVPAATQQLPSSNLHQPPLQQPLLQSQLPGPPAPTLPSQHAAPQGALPDHTAVMNQVQVLLTEIVANTPSQTAGQMPDTAMLAQRIPRLEELEQLLGSIVATGGLPQDAVAMLTFQLQTLQVTIANMRTLVMAAASQNLAVATGVSQPGSVQNPIPAAAKPPAIPVSQTDALSVANKSDVGSVATGDTTSNEGRSVAGPPPLHPNPISILNEAAQRRKAMVRYQEEKTDDDGEAGGVIWEINVIWDGKQVGFGSSKSKKDAKRIAAERALAFLRIEYRASDEVGISNAAAGPTSGLHPERANPHQQPQPVQGNKITEQNVLQTLQMCYPNNVHYYDLGFVGSGQSRQFTARISCGDYCAEAHGTNKKHAKQLAAMKILRMMGHVVDQAALDSEPPGISAPPRPHHHGGPSDHRPQHSKKSGDKLHAGQSGHKGAKMDVRDSGRGAHPGGQVSKKAPLGRHVGNVLGDTAGRHRSRSPMAQEGAGKAEERGPRKRRRVFDPDAPSAPLPNRVNSGYLAQLTEELDEMDAVKPSARSTSASGGVGAAKSNPQPMATDEDPDSEEEGQIVD